MPICKKCKQDISEEYLFCPYCGSSINSTKPVRTTKKRGNGTGSVYKMPNGLWKAVVILRYYTDENGKNKKVTRSKSGFKTKKEAIEYIPTLKTAVVPVKINLTFSEIYDEWIKIHERKVKKDTLGCYKSAYKYFKPIMYEQFNVLKTEHLQKCVDACPKGKRTKQNMKVFAGLIYKYAIQKDIVDKNYAEFIYIENTAQKERIAFSTEDINKLFKLSHTDMGAKFVLCLIYTGFRLEEYLSLTKEQYFTENDYSYFIGGMKTTAGKNRTVTISPKIKPFIDEFLKVGNKYIFSFTDKKMTQKTFRNNIFYPTLEKAGIIPEGEEEHIYTPHCCRHTFATLMKKVDAPTTDKKELIGHSSFEMTAHYTHTDLQSLKNITDLL